MQLTVETPALIFPAISLVLLAYTNRFLGIATLIRKLHDQYKKNGDPTILRQIQNLRRRVTLIRDMQILSVISVLTATLTIILIFTGHQTEAKWAFGTSISLFVLSLCMSLIEIFISTQALNILLKDFTEENFLDLYGLRHFRKKDGNGDQAQ